MWIFLSILAFIVILITAILLLPVYIIIKNDENNNLILLYKILFKTFGENPDPDNPIVNLIKESSGVSKIEKKNLEKNIEQSGLASTVGDTMRILMNLLKEVPAILKHCTAKKFHIKVVCSEDNAADTAISYGQCCAAVYPITSFLSSNMKVKRRGQNIDISTDFTQGESVFRYDLLISVRLYRAIIALFKVAYKEAQRNMEKNPAQNAKNHVR